MKFNYCMMTYTVARQWPGRKPDMVELCRMTRRLGLDSMDQVHLYDYDPKEIRTIADDHGIRIVAHTFGADLNHPDPEGRKPGLETVRKGLEAANILGAPVVMLPINGKQDQTRDQTRANVIEGLRDATKLAADAGIKLSVEHFPNRFSPFITSKDVAKATAELPDLYVTFDSGNVITGGEDPCEAFRNSADRLVHIHFKDFIHPDDESGFIGLDGQRYRGALIGEGLLDYPALLATMNEVGYDGYIDIEYEGSEYKAEQAIAKALDNLRAMEAEL